VNVTTAGGIPETFRVSLHPAGENVIVTGEYDYDDLETLRTSLLSLTQELSNLTRELHKKNAELTKLNELKNRFLGMAAHDLRHPISAIASYSEFLSEELEGKLTDEQTAFLSVIQSSSRFMSHIINNLLDVSAIESGNFILEVEIVDVPALIGKTVVLHKPAAEKKGIAIEVTTDGHIPNIVADPGKVEQVVSNLLSNGIKFSPSHTTIVVRIVTDADAVVVSVSDQGQGIPRKEQDKLFKPFSKTSVRPTAGERSSGLGLAIAKNIVTAHGGKMWLDSEQGKGSTFSFSLPFKGK
jgi:signal transduction histidine kinase